MNATRAAKERTSPKRRTTLRVRFRLRTLVVLVTLVGAWLGWEAKQARDQERFIAAIDAVSGRYEVGPRTWIPEIIRMRLQPAWANRVEQVQLTGAMAPLGDCFTPYAYLPFAIDPPVIASDELLKVLQMPGSNSIRRLELMGTSINDEFLPIIAQLSHLDSYSFYGTVMSDSGHVEFLTVRPDLDAPGVYWGGGVGVSKPKFLGLEQVKRMHGDIFGYVSDISIFPRSISGDANAIAAVLDLADRPEAENLPIKNTLNLIAAKDLSWLEPGLNHKKPEVRRAAYAVMLQHGDRAKLSAIGLNDEALQDIALGNVLIHHFWQFGEQVANLSMTGPHREQATMTLCEFPPDRRYIPALISASESLSQDLRWLVARSMRSYCDDNRVVTALEGLLQDDQSYVRAVAVKSLANSSDPSVIPIIERALNDPDSTVRKYAQMSLAKVTK